MRSKLINIQLIRVLLGRLRKQIRQHSLYDLMWTQQNSGVSNFVPLLRTISPISLWSYGDLLRMILTCIPAEDRKREDRK
jgi:hypothetical protein